MLDKRNLRVTSLIAECQCTVARFNQRSVPLPTFTLVDDEQQFDSTKPHATTNAAITFH